MRYIFQAGLTGLCLLFSAKAHATTITDSFRHTEDAVTHISSGVSCPVRFGDMVLSEASDINWHDTPSGLCDYKSISGVGSFIWILIEKDKNSAKKAHSKSVKNLTHVSSGKIRHAKVKEDFFWMDDQPIYGTIWSRPGFSSIYGTITEHGERGFWTSKTDGWVVDLSLTWNLDAGEDYGLLHAKSFFTATPLVWGEKL